jgi:hypothetical protein
MELKNGNYCPLVQKDCIGLQCAWFTQVRGHNPNTGKEVDEWACAVTWLPVLLIENSQQQRSTSAAVESFRNEMVKSNETGQRVLLSVAKSLPLEQSLTMENKL